MFFPAAVGLGAKIFGGTLGKQILGSAASSLIGNIADKFRKNPTTTTTQSAPDLVGLRNAAEAAGFNPLTAIRTQSAGRTTTSTDTLPTLSPLGAIADAIGAGTQAWVNYDPHEEKQRELELKIMNEQYNQLIAPKAKLGRPGAGGKNPHEPEVFNMWIDVFDDRTGETIRMLNPDLTDATPADMWEAYQFMLKTAWVQNDLGLGGKDEEGNIRSGPMEIVDNVREYLKNNGPNLNPSTWFGGLDNGNEKPVPITVNPHSERTQPKAGWAEQKFGGFHIN